MFKGIKEIIIVMLVSLVLLSFYVNAQCAAGELKIKEEAGNFEVLDSKNNVIQGDFKTKQEALDFMEKAKAKSLECGKIDPTGEISAKRLTKLDGSIFEDLLNVKANPDETLTGESIKLEDGNTYQNFENLRTENGNIIADAFTFEAKQQAELSVINQIDNTKLRFDIPAGTIIKIENDGPFFKIINTGDINLDILSRCSPVFYSSIGGSELQIEKAKNGNSLYSFKNGALEFNSNSKKQLLRSDEISKVEVDSNCNGFVCLDLGIEARFDYEDKLNSFYLENSNKESYNFCFDKKGDDGYKINNKITLNNIIKFFNFKKDLVYASFDENNEAFLEINPDGIIKNFELSNKNPEKQRIADVHMSKNFVVIEEKDHSYITSLKAPETYTIIEAYEPSGFPGISPVWMDNDILYFAEGKVKMYPENHSEFLSSLAEDSKKLERIRANLIRWGDEELANRI